MTEADYFAIAHFAQTWGLVMLGALFVLSVIYALWPGNRAKFEQAARAPLDDDDAREDDEE